MIVMGKDGSRNKYGIRVRPLKLYNLTVPNLKRSTNPGLNMFEYRKLQNKFFHTGQ